MIFDAHSDFGISSIGIGADFMDYIEDLVVPYFKEHKYPSTIYTYPSGMESVADIYVLIDNLKKRGYTKNEISKISYDNMERVILKSSSCI